MAASRDLIKEKANQQKGETEEVETMMTAEL